MPIYFDGPKGRNDRPKLLVVEGQDDAHFFDKLLTDAAADPSQIGIIYTGGTGGLERELALLAKSRPFIEGRITKIGIVQDADADPAAKINSIHAALQSIGFPSPGHGAFQAVGPLTVGVFLLPNALVQGDLELVCLSTVEATDKAQRVVAYFDGMDADYGPFDRKYKRQAFIYLACVDTETRGVGHAFSEGVFDSDHQSLIDVKNFVTAMVA